MFLTPGHYGLINVLISLTLTLLIFGYVWRNERTQSQSLPTCDGAWILALLPFWGYIGEVSKAHDPIEFTQGTLSNGIANQKNCLP